MISHLIRSLPKAKAKVKSYGTQLHVIMEQDISSQEACEINVTI